MATIKFITRMKLSSHEQFLPRQRSSRVDRSCDISLSLAGFAYYGIRPHLTSRFDATPAWSRAWLSPTNVRWVISSLARPCGFQLLRAGAAFCLDPFLTMDVRLLLWAQPSQGGRLSLYRGVEQLAARLAHNQEVGGSSPSAAIYGLDVVFCRCEGRGVCETQRNCKLASVVKPTVHRRGKRVGILPALKSAYTYSLAQALNLAWSQRLARWRFYSSSRRLRAYFEVRP